MQEIPQENHRLQLQQLHQVPQVNVSPILAEPSPQLFSATIRSTATTTTPTVKSEFTSGATAALENLNTQVIIK